ncbi:TIR domain-containing protein [Paractinoplanes durhamensis]|uniref:TIR domain-containing protein n=1 Tax=Paractinoplanes durhamensis TaxID=113563 RepID=UPI003641FA38
MEQGGARDQINIFLSYAREDGKAHVRRFFDELSRTPRYSVVYDRHFRPSVGVDRSIEATIKAADVMIVVLTDAAARSEWVRRELLRADALNRNKPRIRVIVAQMTEDPDVPLTIQELPPLNFHTDPDAWALLYAELEQESSPVNGAQVFRPGPADERHAAAAREAAERAQEERRRADDPAGAERRLRERVDAEWQREQRDEGAVRTDNAVLFINEMPELPEVEFQDRVPKMTELDGWLSGPETRLVLITGDGGTGKTAFLRELRRRLADRKLTAPAEAFVYLAVRGYRQVSAAALLNDLARAASNAGDLQRTIRGRKESWRERLNTVLGALGRTPVIVAIDDAEELLDDQRGEIFDRDLRLVLNELIKRSEHRIRILMVVNERARHPIREAFPGVVQVLDLERGCPPTTRPRS